MKRVLLVAAALHLAGCATTAGFATMMDGYIGQPESALIARLGVPSSTYQLDAKSKMLQFDKSRTIVLPGMTTTTPVRTTTNGQVSVGQMGQLPATGTYTSTSTTWVPSKAPDVTIAQQCSVRFKVDSGIVTSWTADGNACRAVPPN